MLPPSGVFFFLLIMFSAIISISSGTDSLLFPIMEMVFIHPFYFYSFFFFLPHPALPPPSVSLLPLLPFCLGWVDLGADTDET